MPYNKGLPFRFVRLEQRDGSRVEGILCEESTTSDAFGVRDVKREGRRDYIRTVVVPAKDVTAHDEFRMPPVPDVCYDSTSNRTGGIGKHVRWKVIVGTSMATAVVHACGIVEKASFEQVIHSCGSEVEFYPEYTHAEYRRMEDGGWVCDLKLRDASDIPRIQTLLASEGVTCLSADSMTREADLLSEKMSRARHLWKKSYGPTRCLHNWRQPFLPPSWKSAVFTWKHLVDHILGDVGNEDAVQQSEGLPLPLRSYVLAASKGAAADEPADEEETRYRSGGLSEAQHEQMLACSFLTWYSEAVTISDEDREVMEVILMRYMLCGWTCRVAGKYTRTGRHRGYGKVLRRYTGDTAAEYEQNVDAATLSRICDGVGCKGVVPTTGRKRRAGRPDYGPVRRPIRESI